MEHFKQGLNEKQTAFVSRYGGGKSSLMVLHDNGWIFTVEELHQHESWSFDSGSLGRHREQHLHVKLFRCYHQMYSFSRIPNNFKCPDQWALHGLLTKYDLLLFLHIYSALSNDIERDYFISNWKWIVERPTYGCKEVLLPSLEHQRALSYRTELIGRGIYFKSSSHREPYLQPRTMTSEEAEQYEDWTSWNASWDAEESDDPSDVRRFFNKPRCPSRGW